tara:strand:- start:15165 stop:17513 length:2349 start_codon:yes stop_codon:yes gene_type:complete
MANKYSNFKFEPYKSVYVDPQTTEIQKILRERWDQNRSKYDLLDNSLNSMQVGEGDQTIKDNAVANLNSTFENSIKNRNWEDQSSLISSATNDFIGNEGLNLARDSYKVHLQSEADKQKIRNEQGNVLFEWDYVKDPNTEDGYARDANGELIKQDKFANHRSYYTDENTGEIVRNLYSPEHEKMGDWDGTKTDMIGTIQKNPTQLGQLSSVLNLTTGQLSGYLASGKGLTAERGAAIAKGLAQTYAQSTAEGQQQIRHLMEQDVNPATGVPYTKEEAIAQIGQQFMSHIQQQVGTEVDYRDDKVLLESIKNEQTSIQNNNLLGPQIQSDPVPAASTEKQVFAEFHALDHIISPNGITQQRRITTASLGEMERGLDGVGYVDYFDKNGKYVFSDGGSEAVDTAIANGDKDAAITALSDKFKQTIEQQGFGDDPSLSAEEAAFRANNKYIETHMDQYVAYLMTENAGFRGQFSSDKDFLQAIQGAKADLSSYQDSYYQIDNQAFQLEIGDRFKSGNFSQNKMSFVDHNGQITESTMGDGSDASTFTAVADYYSGKKTIGTGLGTSNKKKGNRSNNSGSNPSNTLAAITAARADNKNWNVIGFDPKKGYVVQLNVPEYNKGLGGETTPFNATFHVEASETIMAATANVNAFQDPFRDGNMSVQPVMDLGTDANGNVLIGTVEYYPGKSSGSKRYNTYESTMIVRNYAPSDIENGRPIEGAQPIEHGLPLTDEQGNQLHHSATERHFVGKDNIYNILAKPLKDALNFTMSRDNLVSYTESSGKKTN